MASTPYPAGVESFPLLSITTPESMTLPAYFATKDIIFITSYPKSGTTWMQNIVTSLLLGSEGYDKAVDHISNYTPFLESPKTHSTIEAFFHKFDGFSCFNTHLLCDIHLPNSMWEQQPKRCFVIYCVRNMKDTIVSFYHHLSNQKGNESAAGMTFKSFLLEFVSGRLPYGCYLKHVQYYRELAVSGGGRGLAGKVLLVRYEDMIADLSGSIGAVASHLHLTLDGVEVAALAERNTFKYMSERQGRFAPTSVDWKEGSGFQFVRKGVVGDHKHYFDLECDAIAKDYVKSHFGEAGVPQWFQDLQSCRS